MNKNVGNYSSTFLLFLILFPLLPVFVLSIDTPFCLIDDLGDWTILKSVSSLSGMKDLISEWLTFDGTVRFRPIYQITNIFTWSVFQTNAAMHHAFRWFLKGVTVYFVVGSVIEYSKLRSKELGSVYEENFPFLSVFVSLAFILYFPNNPEARLAPTELQSGLFMAMNLWAFIKIVNHTHGNNSKKSSKLNTIFLFSLIGMAVSKEPNIALIATTVFLLLVFSLKKGFFFKNFLWFYSLMTAIFLVFRLMISFRKTPGSGQAFSLAVMSFLNMFFSYLKSTFLVSSTQYITWMMILPILIALYIKLVQLLPAKDKSDPKSVFSDSILVFFSPILLFFSYLTVMSLVGLHFHRYGYQLIVYLACIIGFSVEEINKSFFKSKFRAILQALVIVGSLYFVSFNYANFVYQFYSQWHQGTAAKKAITYVKNLVDSGERVIINYKGEPEGSFYLYFTGFLPYFEGYEGLVEMSYDLQAIKNIPGKTTYIVSRVDLPLSRELIDRVEPDEPRIMQFADRISSFVRGSQTKIDYTLDGGVSGYWQNAWLVYRNQEKGNTL